MPSPKPHDHFFKLKVNFLMPGVENLFFLLNEGLSALLVQSTGGILAHIAMRVLVFGMPVTFRVFILRCL